ncbi:MAG: DUF4190 domain-containing protein [Deltaproteobacteria bacterium]|nr:DUF4190 domain-containing protein [Deltaproteobacteria bacterium]
MKCAHCGRDIDNKAVICVHCGKSIMQENTDMISRMLLPVGRSGYAITAGYLALFSVLIVPAPLAFIFGLLAYFDIKKNPQKHGLGRAWFGIIMGALGTLILLWFIFQIMMR